MAYEVFEIERDAHVATVWLANPAKRNAMGPAFWEELPRVMTELGDDESVRAIVIAARGAHFTVGLDLKAMSGGIIEGGNGAGARKHLLDFILKIQRTVTTVANARLRPSCKRSSTSSTRVAAPSPTASSASLD